MNIPHSGAPPGADVKRAALGEATRGTAADTANSTPPGFNAQSSGTLPQFSKHAFVAWAVARGHVPPARMVESILSELGETT